MNKDSCQAFNAARRLRTARVLADLSQDELGRRAKIDRSIISRVENGYRALTEEQRARIADALGLPVGDVFPGDEG